MILNNETTCIEDLYPTEDNAIVTLSIGDKYQEVAEVAKKHMAVYAKKINADFVVIDKVIKNIKGGTPHFEKAQIEDLLQMYERVAYFDIDILIRSWAPNIFKEIPVHSVGVYNEYTNNNGNSGAIRRDAKRAQSHLGDIGWELKERGKGFFFNSGVMVASREHHKMFQIDPDRYWSQLFQDQTQLNYNLQANKFKIHDLARNWNWMHFCNKRCAREDAFVIHYAAIREPDIMLAKMKEDDIAPKFFQESDSLVHLPRYVRNAWTKWSPTKLEMRQLKRFVLLSRPASVVEIGSGATTLMLGHIKKDHYENLRIFSIEDSDHWYETVSTEIKRQNLEIEYQQCETHNGIYRIDDAKLPRWADLIFIDGTRKGREQVLYDMDSVLKRGTTIILHDAARTEIEQKYIKGWKSRYDLSVEYHLDTAVDNHRVGKGFAVITFLGRKK